METNIPTIDDLKRFLIARLEAEARGHLEPDDDPEPDHEFDETDLALGKD